MNPLQNRVIEILKTIKTGDSISIRELSDRLDRKETINNFMKKFVAEVEAHADGCIKKDKLERKTIFTVVKDPSVLDSLVVERKTKEKTEKAKVAKKAQKVAKKKVAKVSFEGPDVLDEEVLLDPIVEDEIEEVSAIESQWADFAKELEDTEGE